MEIFDIEHSQLDGGSVKVYWKKKTNMSQNIIQKNIDTFLKNEEELGLYTDKIYDEFAKGSKGLKKPLRKSYCC